MVFGVIPERGSCELGSVHRRRRRQVGRRGRIVVWSLREGGLNGMCVRHVGEQELCPSGVGSSCGVVDQRVHGL